MLTALFSIRFVTILAVIASIQISTHDLVKEGDWLEVPSYDADGDGHVGPAGHAGHGFLCQRPYL